ncbi:MAG TPA: lipase family protein [Gammaproteobacteria bacterium]|jgi:hypothetical protein
MRDRLALLTLLSLLPMAAMSATQVAPVAAAKPAPPAAVKSPLGCKLIKASAYAYDIGKTGPITDPTLPALLGEQGEGYGVASAATDTQDGNRDAGYVWHSGDELIVAFRGTLPYTTGDQQTSQEMLSIEDWLNDANARPAADPDLGQVHGGFEAALQSVWPGLMQQIKAWQAAGKLGPNPKIYVTGHSKGGALAMLAAVKLKAAKLPVTEVDTFGAPRVGGTDFAAKYAGIDGIRYETTQDLVPHVPLNALELSLAPLLRRVIDIQGSPFGDFVSVGKLKYIDADGSIQTPADAAAEDDLEKARLEEFAPLIFSSAQDISDTLIGAHSIGDMSATDDSRYYQAVCSKP